jgi:hypothetical protein
MDQSNQTKILFPDDIWVISDGKNTLSDLRGICNGMGNTLTKEYRISALAWYLLNPNPITVENKIMGCEIHYQQPLSIKFKKTIQQALPNILKGLIKTKYLPPEVLISNHTARMPVLKDKALEKHFNRINELTMPYGSVIKKLLSLDTSKITDIKGVCQKTGGKRLLLELKGDIYEKADYIRNNIKKNVPIILHSSCVSEGLFEMKGFDFSSYNPQKHYKLILFKKNGENKSCVINSNNKVEFWIHNTHLINYLHLLKQSLKTDSHFYDSFDLCRRGRAKPMLLFFNKQLAIDYSKIHTPGIYKKVFETCNMGTEERNTVMNSLRNLQLGISFKYIHQQDSGEEKILTNISVMHDFKALETIKDHFPLLYSEINKMAPISEAGKFYLLDSMRGCTDE